MLALAAVANRIGNDNEQIQIAVRIVISPSSRVEEKHFFRRGQGHNPLNYRLEILL